MGDGFGKDLYESISGIKLSLSSSLDLPSWQDPYEELLICQGHAKYSFESHFCQFDEKFLKFVNTPYTMTFKVQNE